MINGQFIKIRKQLQISMHQTVQPQNKSEIEKKKGTIIINDKCREQKILEFFSQKAIYQKTQKLNTDLNEPVNYFNLE